MYYKRDLKMHVRNLAHTLPYKSGAQATFFRRLSQLTGNFNGIYIRNKTRHRQLGKCVNNYKESPISSQNFQTKREVDNRAKSSGRSGRGFLHYLKISWTLVHKRRKIWPEFLSTLRKFCVLLRCQAFHTEVSKQNQTLSNGREQMALMLAE